MKTIQVMANPYTAVDKDGIPQGTVCPPGSPTTHIGASIDQTLSQRLGRERFYFPLHGETKGVYKVPLTGEIARSVREGELIAADERSATLAGVPAGKYLAPDVALSREKERAEALFIALVGDDEDAPKLQDVPREPVERTAEDDMTEGARRHRGLAGVVVIADPPKAETSKTEKV